LEGLKQQEITYRISVGDKEGKEGPECVSYSDEIGKLRLRE
jgi:hypothetical protein